MLVMSRKMEEMERMIQNAEGGYTTLSEDDSNVLFEIMTPSDDELESIEKGSGDSSKPKKRKKSRSTKPHILDRDDKTCWGGWLRYHFYKEIGGRHHLILSNDTNLSETACRCCGEPVVDTSDKDNVLGSLNLSDVHLRTQDEFNRQLPELTLALLQLYDWVGTCSCGGVNFGYTKFVESPSSVQSKPEDSDFHNDIQCAELEEARKQIAAASSIGFINKNKSSIIPNGQMTIFDFDC